MPLLKSAYLVRICINKENSSCIITSYGQCESKFVFPESWNKLSSRRVKKCIQIKYHLIVNNLWNHGEIKIQLDPNKVCFLLHSSSNLFQSFNILSYSFTTSQLIQTQKVPQVHISVIHIVTIGMSLDKLHVTNSMTFPQAGQYHCAKTEFLFP